MSSMYTPGYGQNQNYLSPKVNFGWINESFEIYRTAWLPWLLVSLVPIGAYILMFGAIAIAAAALHTTISTTPTIRPNTTHEDPFFLAVAVGSDFLFYAILFVVLMCSSDIALRQVKGELIEPGDIFHGLRHFWQYLFFGFLSYIAYMAGTLALCIGSIVAAGILLPGSALVADGVPAITAFSRCVEGMKRDWVNAALFYFVFNLLIVFGTMITCGLGAFVLFPMYYIVAALAYRDMIGIPTNAAWQTAASSPIQSGTWPPPPRDGQSPYGQQTSPYGQPPRQYGQPPIPPDESGSRTDGNWPGSPGSK